MAVCQGSKRIGWADGQTVGRKENYFSQFNIEKLCIKHLKLVVDGRMIVGYFAELCFFAQDLMLLMLLLLLSAVFPLQDIGLCSSAASRGAEVRSAAADEC